MREKIIDVLDEHPDAVFYVNLTDGLEAVDDLVSCGIDKNSLRFSMIQSTHFEQKNIDAAINRLGPDLLMNLALGKTCVVVDYGTDKELSRAVYQGIPFIKYALERCWFGRDPDEISIVSRESDADPRPASDVFRRWYKNLDRRTKGFIRRFKVYATDPIALKTNNCKVSLMGISVSTDQDGHPGYYARLASKNFC